MIGVMMIIIIIMIIVIITPIIIYIDIDVGARYAWCGGI
jgi:hypothetical protein